MKIPTKWVAGVCLVAGLPLAIALVRSSFSIAAEPRAIQWVDLIPEGERQAAPLAYGAHHPMDSFGLLQALPSQAAGVVDELDGEKVAIAGFIVPLDFNYEDGMREALLVPYFGACVHFPPPPANQIIFLTWEEPLIIDNIWQPFTVAGQLSTDGQTTAIAGAAYTLAAFSTEPYQPSW